MLTPNLKIGTIEYPLRLCDYAADKGYTNEELESAMRKAYPTVKLIVSGGLSHPLMDLFRRIVGRNGRYWNRAQQLVGVFSIPVLPGDASLAENFCIQLANELGVQETLTEAHIVALTLFQLVILRVYLGRDPSDDDQIYNLVIAPQITQLGTINTVMDDGLTELEDDEGMLCSI